MLLKPARYFPLEKGVYEVAPGLRALGTSFGNGPRDAYVFQIDEEFPKYRENILQCRSERLGKYYCTHEYSPKVEEAVARFLAKQFAKEHPEYFQLSESASESVLECKLTQEVLKFDAQMKLLSCEGTDYASAFDALASQVQEDIAVQRLEPPRDWLAAIHLCSPSHWAAEDKIGKNFFNIHAPIPGIEKINKAAAQFVEGMVKKGPYVRFVWGYANNKTLNQHPENPTNRKYDPKSPFILRIERQVVYGLPEVNASIFTIRIYFVNGEEIKANLAEKQLLQSALQSMSDASLAYKGLRDRAAILEWLG